MPSELLFGFETEWMNFSPGVEPGLVAECAREALRHQMPYLPCHDGGGIFLQNSFRCYVDCGHLETASCEVTNPLDLVAALKGMERILLDISGSASCLLGPKAQVKFGRANVDPVSTNTYGQHESYLTAHPAEFYTKYLVPFLITRPVWSGAGGLVPGSSDAAFAVSPRLLLFATVADSGTTSSRPILNLRNEPLAKSGNYRLHLIAGETLATELGLYLKAGITALVVRTAELGAQIGFEIRDPVSSLHAVARDPSCKKTLRLSDGRCFTAVQIQTEYLGIVETHLANLPAWAPAVCNRWRLVLAALAEDPLLLGRTLDWPIKYSIWNAHVKKTDRRWQGKNLITELKAAAAQTAYKDRLPSLEFLLGPSSPILQNVAVLNETLRTQGLKWTDVQSLADRRGELSEILDVRFGILGDGLFDTLDRQALLEHRVVADESIVRATNEAPCGTRAHLRSKAIKELAGRTGATCSWQRVLDGQGRVLDLSDPEEQSAQWRVGLNSDGMTSRGVGLPYFRTWPPTHDEIAARAYQWWLQRGRPYGSPDVDWRLAESEFRDLYHRITGTSSHSE